MNKKDVYKELEDLYVDNQDNNKIVAEEIIQDLCNFFDSNVLAEFVEFVKEERSN